MKYLLLIAIVIGVLWLTRTLRKSAMPPPSSPPSAPPGSTRPDAVGLAEEIVACAHCDIHLPRGEALPGRGGVFCSEAHRAAFEAARKQP